LTQIPHEMINLVNAHLNKLLSCCTTTTFRNHIYTGSEADNNNIIVWKKNGNQHKKRYIYQKILADHLGPVVCLNVTRNNILLSYSKDGTIRVWDLDNNNSSKIIEKTWAIYDFYASNYEFEPDCECDGCWHNVWSGSGGPITKTRKTVCAFENAIFKNSIH